LSEVKDYAKLFEGFYNLVLNFRVHWFSAESREALCHDEENGLACGLLARSMIDFGTKLGERATKRLREEHIAWLTTVSSNSTA
jgi:hypothetical protein